MKGEHNKSVYPLYIRIKNGKVFKTRKEDSGLIDYDEEGNILGIEILNYSKQESILQNRNMPVLNEQIVTTPKWEEKIINVGGTSQTFTGQVTEAGENVSFSSTPTRVRLEDLQVDSLKT